MRNYAQDLKQLQTRMHSTQTYDSADKRVDMRKGAAHGRKGIPGVKDEHHPFRDQLITSSKNIITSYRSALENFVFNLSDEEKQLLKERDEFYVSRVDEVKDDFNIEFGSVERKLGKDSTKHSTAYNDYVEAKSKLQRLESELGRPLRIKLVWIYPFIFIGIMLLEVPVNRFAFEYFFGESPLLSLLLALGLGAMLALSAHWIGTLLKRSSNYSTLRKQTLYYIGVLAILAIIGPLFFMLALVREQYIQFMERTKISFGQILQNEGFTGAAANIVESEMTSAGWTLLLINIALIGLGTGASFLRHDAHPDYEMFSRKAKKSKRRYDKINHAYELEHDKLDQTRKEKISKLDKHHENIEKDLADIEEARKLVQKHDKEAITRQALIVKERLQVYELANRENRSDGVIPKVFNRHDEQEIQHEIQHEISPVVVNFPSDHSCQRIAN